MTCVRCRGLLLTEQAETTDGRLFMLRCLLCGHRVEPLMSHHRLHRPEPFRQLPVKPNRGRTTRQRIKTR